jgi:hypothetical protein
VNDRDKDVEILAQRHTARAKRPGRPRTPAPRTDHVSKSDMLVEDGTSMATGQASLDR